VKKVWERRSQAFRPHYTLVVREQPLGQRGSLMSDKYISILFATVANYKYLCNVKSP